MTNWQSIVESTIEVLETTCAELLNTELKYSDTLVMADGLASSVFNGTYFLRLKGIPTVDDSVNRKFTVWYTVSLELCYQISAGDSVTAYNKAVEDIEIIIRERCKQDSWIDYSDNIQYVKVASVSEPRYTTKGEIYMIIPIDLDFQMVSNY
jgi:hypothetical protein